MKRLLLFAALLMFLPSVAAGKRVPSRTPAQSAAVADVILVGTVTEIAKDPVVAEGSPGTNNKIPFTIATVKVTDAIRGIKDATHVKVGFQPSARSPVNLVEKGEYLLFLTKHHDGGFYVMNWMNPPLALTADTKASVLEVKAIGKILADPAHALKAEKAEDQALAAAVLATHYRTPSESGIEQTTVAVPLAESQSILKALGAVEWGTTSNVAGFNLQGTFSGLGLTEKDGWKLPEFKPGDNYGTAIHKAYAAWLAGPGAKYQIQKYVAKKK